ncbi:MAG: flagellar FliJ family protein [Candidatus Eisenbacteria bacterium]|uniref:Flagellar FliJ protein n=1 Tax=Eiseniibacteriota bacterium TaxID=2212470 RepID=A0A937XEC7_UNCEI|nr:flagellar FliJ family protein [Candidatus Eisenbacteria bacterium]
MKKFRFALHGLERIREIEVDRARARLADSERARQAEEEGIMRLDAALAAGAGACPRQGRLDGAALAAEDRYLGALRDRREEAVGRLGAWIRTVESDRRRFTRARQERQAVERLRERRYLEFVQEVLREEGRELDEVAGVRHRRLTAREAA